MDPFAWVVRLVMLIEAIERYRATLAWLPNFAYHHLGRNLPEDCRLDLGSLRALIDCSEPCKAESLELFAATFGAYGAPLAKMQVCYAMAETVFGVTQTTSTGWFPRGWWIGTPCE